MSQTPTTTSNYQLIFDNALEAYKKKTKKELRYHPLLPKIQACDTPDAVLIVLREQIPAFDQSQSTSSTNDRLSKWLNPTVNVLYAFSGTIGAGISLVYPPAGVIFTGIGILLSAVSAGQDTLTNVFERIENFFRRLETYVQVPPTAGMTDMIVKIMIEVLSILAIATREINQSRTKNYLKKVIGRTDIEDALARLDQLTQEEVRMAAAQSLKATHAVHNEVKSVDDRLQGVGSDVQQVDIHVQRVDDKVQDVDDKVQQVADDIGDQRRDQLRKDLRNWLSPPDPSVNYNTASDARHEGTSLWFMACDAFNDWKVSNSLLWIYGKPGSGKSVLSSSIIQDLDRVVDTISAYVAYFFFDFKDTGKQDAHGLLSSLLVQLSHQSTSLFDILSACYSTHQSGSRQPSDRALTQCLQDMLRFSTQIPIYLILDAVDECPNTTGIPSSRDKVLSVVEKLVKLNLPNLHLCITSRPEIDIRNFLEPLTSNRISLHDQSGQKKDIIDYVNSVVYSDMNMRRWREEDKKVVIEALSNKADGMFRWVFCQLATLRHCLPPSVRRILAELPETLDATYEQILQEIPKSNQVHAHRLLQCLTVASRPLRVKELAEVLAVDFTGSDGIPKVNETLRWDDQEQAVLSACSSLIAVIEDEDEDEDSRVVQFSHFSVKEFLTSDRLATSKIDISRDHHILLEPAHTIMARACLGVLLRFGSHTEQFSVMDFPLAEYAAEYFGDHAEFKGVLSHILDGLDHLLDADKPHFAAWVRMCPPNHVRHRRPDVISLYYVAARGYRSLVDYLISKRPDDVNLRGNYGTPLHAALGGEHVDVAELLLGYCVDVDVRDHVDRTPLHLAAFRGFLSVTRTLVERNADINVRDSSGDTPLHRTMASWRRQSEKTQEYRLDVVKFLLEHGADPDAKNHEHSTPLHQAAYHGSTKGTQLMLEHGANIYARTGEGQTPLHRALDRLDDNADSLDMFLDTIRCLLAHGADVDALDDDHATPLHVTSYFGCVEGARILLEYGANVYLEDEEGRTPFQVASEIGRSKITQLLEEHLQSQQIP